MTVQVEVEAEEAPRRRRGWGRRRGRLKRLTVAGEGPACLSDGLTAAIPLLCFSPGYILYS